MINNNLKKIISNKKNKIKNARILCIGDIILDHYIYGKIHRFSPEAPVPILLSEKEVYKLGGAGNVAKNVMSIGAKPTLIYLSGNDDSSQIINKIISTEKKINAYKIPISKFKTPIKSRYIDINSQIIRVDKEDPEFKINKKNKKIIINKLENEIKKHDLVILSDYCKGIFDNELIQSILHLSKKYQKKVIVDPKSSDLSIYANVDLISPNQKEMSDAVRKKFLSQRDLIKYSKQIINNFNIKNILITRSQKGMLHVDSKKETKA